MFCSNCGAKNDADAVFCSNCGARLNEEPTSSDQTTPVNSAAPTRTAVAQQNSKKLSKKANIIIGVVMGVVVIAAVVGGFLWYNYNQSPHTDQMTTSSNSTNTTASSSSSTKTSDDTTTTKALWSSSKMSQLSSFMSSWQDDMDQSYEGTYNQSSIDVRGMELPKTIKDGSYKNSLLVNNDQVTMKWTEKANTTAEYQVVAAAVYDDSDDPDDATLIQYLFVFHNNQPEVLVSQDYDQPTYNFTKTENKQLERGFESIAN